MNSDKDKNIDVDWEYLEENYKESGNEVKDLEAYITEGIEDAFDYGDSMMLDADNGLFEKTVKDVKNVRELMKEGITVKEIAERLSLEEEYIMIIAVTLNSSTEDDNDVAVAHLVMME